MKKQKYFYSCITCGRNYYDDDIRYLCDDCSKSNKKNNPPKGILKILYDYELIRKKKTKSLFETIKEQKYIDILPISSINSLSPLKVGQTPMYNFKSQDLLSHKNSFDILIKDDALNPTFSHKDRASDLVSAFAREKGIKTIVAASTGNAGSSIAGICASQNQKAIVMVPAKAPVAKLLQIMHYGAQIVTVDGTYDDAFDLSLEISKKYGFYNRNTAYNPLTIEGKKTVAFEIFDDMQQKLPELIFVPVGDGVIISGLYKGLEDLLMLGIIKKMPRIVAVQSTKSKNIIANLTHKNFKIYPSTTIADSISVDIPRNFYMARDYMLKYDSYPLLVTDEEIIEQSQYLSKKTGIFSEPAASAAWAGFIKYARTNGIKENSKLVILSTGCGLKDLRNIEKLYCLPKPISSADDFIINTDDN